jgi:hypothetical protein
LSVKFLPAPKIAHLITTKKFHDNLHGLLGILGYKSLTMLQNRPFLDENSRQFFPVKAGFGFCLWPTNSVSRRLRTEIENSRLWENARQWRALWIQLVPLFE